VPQDAQDFKDELKRIQKYVLELQQKVMKECENYSNDVQYWAEYKIGIKQFRPWLESVEKKKGDGLEKPQTLEDANALFAMVKDFEVSCAKNLRVLQDASAAANKMTTHKDADEEVEGLKQRYVQVKEIADDWVKKVENLVKEWELLDSTVTELNTWVDSDRPDAGEKQFSLEKMESTLGELKNIFKEKEKLVANL
jgi:DNA repair ATPase RecN